MRVLDSIKSGSWLSRDRLRNYPNIFLLLYIIVAVSWLAMANGKLDKLSQPIGTDFVSFYAAGQLAANQQPSFAYYPQLHYKMEQDVIGPIASEHTGDGLVMSRVPKFDYYNFSYPPMFLLILRPLVELPYLAALAVWSLFGLTFYIVMISKLSKYSKCTRESVSGRQVASGIQGDMCVSAGIADDVAVRTNTSEHFATAAGMLALAFPAVFLTIGHGQNALITTGLITGTLFYMDRRPVMAGLLIGLLTFKPHLGVLIPLLLLLTRRWQVFAVAAVVSVILAGLSYMLFGAETWTAFFASTELSSRVLNEGLVPYHKFQSLFAGLRAMGASLPLAYTLHSMLALAAAAVAAWAWTRPSDLRLKFAVLAVATLLITPFVLDYDLMILTVAITCIGTFGMEHGFRPWMISLLSLVWLWPLIARMVNAAMPLPWTPILLILLLFQLVRMIVEISPHEQKSA